MKMNNMTQEEKAKRYDEALKVLHKYDGANIMFTQDLKEEMFPELREESEDERIRKALINGLKRYDDGTLFNGCLVREILAWLEKQGEHKKFRDSIQVGDKVTRNEDGVLVNLSQLKRVAKKDEKQGEQKPTYTKEYDFHGIKFIPKFAKGDIVKDKKCGEISTIEDFSYDTGLYTHTYGQFPITIQDNYEIIEQKPVWSEEDNTFFKAIIRDIENIQYISEDAKKDRINWLKSLKDRVQPQPSKEWGEKDKGMLLEVKCLVDTLRSDGNPDYSVEELQEMWDWLDTIWQKVEYPQPKREWSEEDEKRLNGIINYIAFSDHPDDFEVWIDWLKSLRSQYRWKPSDAQMASITCAVRKMKESACYDSELVSLLNDLKKLREE